MVGGARRRATLLGTVVAVALACLVPGAHAAELVLEGTFDQPVHLTGESGAGTLLYITERAGVVRARQAPTTFATPVLDQRSITRSSGGEEGLLSIAFGPAVAGSGARPMFVYYVTLGGDLRIDVLSVQGLRADPGSRREVVTIPHPGEDNHNGGQLAFGPDGALYAGIGDGGGGGDPDNSAQDPGSRLGKILRIDPATFAVTTWASGVRNPWRFAFAPDGAMVVADVGQNAVEEVSVVRGANANLGWKRFEGSNVFSAGTPLIPGTSYVPPVIEQQHADGWCSITGGVFGKDGYLYGDFCRGEVLIGDLTTGRSTDTRLRVSQLSTFGSDGCGRPYVASLSGSVYRIDDGSACPPQSPTGVLPPVEPPGAGGVAGGGGAATAPAAADRTAPRVRVRAARVQRPLRSGRIRVRLSCDEECRLALRGHVLERPLRPTAARRVAAGARVTLDVRLPAATRRALGRALRRGSRPRARVTVRVSDAAGNARTARFLVALRR